MTKKYKIYYLIYVLFFISIGYFATDIYLPSLPSIAEYFDTSTSLVKITLFSYLLSFSFAPLICGPMSDHYGRKKVILLGMILSVISSFGCYLSNSIYSLILFRFFQGIGTGSVVVSARAIITDLYVGKELAKKFTIVSLAIPIFLAIAPAVGGSLQENFGWQAVFLFLVIYLIIVLFGTYLLEETVEKPEVHIKFSLLANYKPILRNKSFMLYGGGFVLSNMGYFAYLTASPFLFQNLIGLSAESYGYLAIYVSLVIMFFSLVNMVFIRYLSLCTIMLIGNCFVLLSGILLVSFHFMNILTFYSLFIPCLIFFPCLPLTSSNSIVRGMGQIKRGFGSASAFLTTVQLLAGTFATLIFSYVGETDTLPLGIWFIFQATLSVVVLYYASKAERVEK